MSARFLLIFFFVSAGSAFLAPRSATKAPYTFAEEEHLRVPHQYIVKLHDNHTLDDHYANLGLNLSRIADDFFHFDLFNSYFIALTDNLSSRIIHDLIRHDPGVKIVGLNQYVDLRPPVNNTHHTSVLSATELKSTNLLDKKSNMETREQKFNTQTRKSRWNLEMISRGNKGSYGKDDDHLDYDSMSYTYKSIENPGQGVDVYILDSGMKIEHKMFNGKASHFGNLASTDFSPYCSNKCWNTTMADYSGHGTHVAGIVSSDVGVAPGANVINVKLGCITTGDKTVKALYDVVKAHNAKVDSRPTGWRGSVINVSQTFGERDPVSISEAFETIQRNGIPVAAAAGNLGESSFGNPATLRSVISVGGVDPAYKRWGASGGRGSSAHSKKLNIWAPGAGIWSLDYLSDGEQALSGTSQATPHVAGVMAIFVSNEWQYDHAFDAAFQRLIYDLLEANQIDAVISDPEMIERGSPAVLLQSGIGSSWKPDSFPYAVPQQNA